MSVFSTQRNQTVLVTITVMENVTALILIYFITNIFCIFCLHKICILDKHCKVILWYITDSMIHNYGAKLYKVEEAKLWFNLLQ